MKRTARTAAVTSPIFNVTAREIDRNNREDNAIDTMAAALRAAQSKRAGRPVNEYGWAWCAGCGAEKIIVDRADAALTGGRCSATCSSCSPGERDFRAVAWWRYTMTDADRAGLTLAGFCKSSASRSVEIPVEWIERAAEKLRPAARVAVQTMVDTAGETWIDERNRTVLEIGSDEDRALIAGAVALSDSRRAAHQAAVVARRQVAA